MTTANPANKDLRLSPAGANLIKHYESCLRPVGKNKFKAYYCPAGVLTIGWGHTNHHGRKFKVGDTWTQKECDAEFAKDMVIFENAVKRLVKVPLNQNQFDALVSFTYNIGEGAFSTSTLLRKLNAGDFENAALEFPGWNKGGGKVLKGLVRRRASEALLFQSAPDPNYGGKIEPAPTDEVMAHQIEERPVPPIAALASPETIQSALIAMGLLDPPADGVIGSVTRWALKQVGITDEITAENVQAVNDRVAAMPALPLNPHDDFAGKIIRAMQRVDYWIARHPDCLNIVYLEGANPNGTLNPNSPNHFNDLRLLIRVIDGVPKIINKWEATTEPGRYWTMNPMNPKGAARIAFGQYKSWGVGTHKGDHEALVQVAPVTVYRDRDKDFKRDGDEMDTGLFGINQHWGYDLPKHDLGRSCAGCLVGRTRSGHREFMKLLKGDARYIASGGSYKFLTTIMLGTAVFAVEPHQMAA